MAGETSTEATRRNVVRDGALDLALLRDLTDRPALFAPGDPDPIDWSDPAIADDVLRGHLEWHEGQHHRPSLEPELFDHISRWLIEQLGLRPGQRVLDLGCGVGFNALSLTEHGLSVTGIDRVPVLVDYARHAARERGLTIDYRCQDYRTIDFVAEFDAVLQLGGAFQNDSPSDLEDFLRRVRRALGPGGHYVPEILTQARRLGCPPPWWDCSDGPHGPELVLGQTMTYPDDVSLLQSVVLQPDGTLQVFRTWRVDYTPASATAAVEARGFAVRGCWADVTGKPYAETTGMLLLVARAV